MRNLIVKHFFLNREFKIFGKMVKVKRAATPTVIAFFIGVLLQTLLDSHWIVTLICWIPFAIAIFLGFFYHIKKPVKYEELASWSQKLQYLMKPDSIGTYDETFPFGREYLSEVNRLKKRREHYFEGKYNVDVAKGLAPTWITVIGALLFVWFYS